MQTLISPGFEKLLGNHSLEEIMEDKNSIFGLWNDFTLGFVNTGWINFAEENQGPSELSSPECLGTDIIEVCGEKLAPFYRDLFQSALSAGEEELHPHQHQYECSSPELYRKFLMTVYPLGAGEGLLVTNSLVVEMEHHRRKTVSYPADPSEYRDENGLIHQCSHCRKVKHTGPGNRWDWVPEWVRELPSGVSHTLCQVCLDHYYPEE